MAREQFSTLVIVGGGPAGLSAAVNASSEGLATTVIECCKVLGGQAKYSSRIENYLGFPNGLTGLALTSRASNQAERFGANFVTGQHVIHVQREGRLHCVTLEDGSLLVCRALLIASGLLWRKLKAKNIDLYQGVGGVHYGASMADAQASAGKDIIIVGGANSAGQAVIYFAKFAKRVTMLVRGDSLEKGMSHYLIERIRALPNVDVQLKGVLRGVEGADGLMTGATIKAGRTIGLLPASELYTFIGAEPTTHWLTGICDLDERGFVNTGADNMTSCPGLFAAGDVRVGSTKRVATAVGEGATSIGAIHRYLGGF